jgi:hypothetical protein
MSIGVIASSYVDISASAYATAVLADSPLVWWRQGEASGTVMVDSSGNGRNGTFAGTITHGVTSLLPTETDTATTYVNSGAHGTIAYSSWMNNANVTAELWIKPTSTANNTLLGRTSSGGQWYVGTNSNKFRFAVSTNGTFGGMVNVDAPSTFSTGTVYYVVGTYDGTTARLYVNKVEAASAPVASMGSNTSSNLAVCEFANGPTIDEVAVYSTALSPTRISARYDAA